MRCLICFPASGRSPTGSAGRSRLRLARGLVASKLRNCRTLVRRNTREDTPPEAALGGLRRAARAVSEAKNLGELLGVEGNGAAIYFASLGAMLRGGDGDGRELPRFEFENRNRRPATDPVNAVRYAGTGTDGDIGGGRL